MVLILHTYLTFVFCVCLPLYQQQYFITVFIYFVISSTFVTLLVYCYLKTVFTHPGLVPSEYHLNAKQKKMIAKRGWNRFSESMEQNLEDLLQRQSVMPTTATTTTTAKTSVIVPKTKPLRNQQSDEDDDSDADDSEYDSDATHEEDVGDEEGEEDWDNVEENKRLIVEKSKVGHLRGCSVCHSRKPDRSHHCRSCRTCILKMDHHCPWVNNCVGFYNYKYFVLFIFYTMLACFSIVFPMMRSFVEIFDQVSGEDNPFNFGLAELNILWAFFIAFAFGASMALFLAYHFRLILMNMTTLESLEKQGKFMAQYHRNPYDLGVWKNLQAALGEKWYLWLVPTYHSVPGHGASFPIYRYETASELSNTDVVIQM